MNRILTPLVFLLLSTALILAACTAAPGPARQPTSTSATISQTTPARTAALPAPTSTPAPTTTASPTRTPSPLPTLSPQEFFRDISQNLRVAFYNENTNQICVMNGDGSDQVCLDLNKDNFANGYPTVGFLALSPDGTKVAYATECNIYIWTPGESLTALRDDPTCPIFMQPDWSPDGNFIAYTSHELQRTAPSAGQVFLSDVFLASLDGMVHRPLTADLEGGGGYPAWSPDGRRIAFASGGMFVYSLDTNQAINLTPGLGGGNPAWLPDGQFITFTRRNGENVDLYMMQSDGSGRRKVAELDLKPIWAHASDIYTWLPEGKYILYHDQLIHTITGKSDKVSLPFDSIYASWAMAAENEVFALLPSPTPRPTLDPSSGQIAFTSCTSDDSNSCEIYVMNADGSHPVRLTNDSAWNCCPAWSPDGARLVFVANEYGPVQGPQGEIYVIDADGSHLTQLTDGDNIAAENPTWSPDGTKIAFADWSAPGAGIIHVMNADGSHITQLAWVTAYADNPLGWSPNGASIVFESHRYVYDAASPPHDIYVLKADGSGVTNLTDNSFYDGMPAWSPDGTKIAFVSDRDGNAEIYVLNADGSNPTNLTNTSGQDNMPAWSPDGTKIAFVSDRDGNAEIYVMNADGSHPTNLTNTGAEDRTPAWSPDGTRIAFVSARDGSAGIFVMNADGSNPTELVGNINDHFWLTLTWSPAMTSRLIQHPDCTSGWTRLEAGSQAKVSEESTTPNRVRSGPSTAEETFFLIYPGTEMKIIEGPICADGLVFWKVQSDLIPGGVGWTAEGDGTEYWLEPVAP